MIAAPAGAIPPAAVVAMRRTTTEHHPGTAGTLSSNPEEADAEAEGARALRVQLTATLVGTASMDVFGRAVILDLLAARAAVEMTEVTGTG